MHFIFMLTQNDQTVANAHAVYAEIAHLPLRHIGFKDIGLPIDDLVTLAQTMKRDGKVVMLEVVASNREAELASIEAACRIGVDYVLGGRHVEDAVRILKGRNIQYYPFAGHTVGHPTQLMGSAAEIVADAQRLAAMPGVHGLDLLAYRAQSGVDVPALAQQVMQAVNVPVIAAGSIADHRRVAAMHAAQMWGFTVGSAVFDGSFDAGSNQSESTSTGLVQHLQAILALDGVSA